MNMDGLKHNGTPTSIAAAKSVTLTKVQQDRKAITAFLARVGDAGACDDEIARAVPTMNGNSVRLRRQECVDYGLISNVCGQLNKTASGKNAVAFHILRRGLEALGMDPALCWHADKSPDVSACTSGDEGKVGG